MLTQGQGEGKQIPSLDEGWQGSEEHGGPEMLSYWENTTFDILDMVFVSQFINKMFSKYGAVNTCAIVITEHVKCPRGLYKFFGQQRQKTLELPVQPLIST